MKDSEIYGIDHNGTRRLVRLDNNGDLRSSYRFNDVTSTGYAALTRSQEVSIISGVASTRQDLAVVTGSNTSTVAVSVSIRMGTAGGVVDTLVIPIGSSVSKTYPVPIPQDEAGAAITAQVATADQSDSPVTINMIAIKRT